MDRLEGGSNPPRKSMTSFKADAEGTVAMVSVTSDMACTKNTSSAASSSSASSMGSITLDGFSVPEMTVSEMGDQ